MFGNLPGLPQAPPGWLGPVPDLYVETKRKCFAILMTGGEDLEGQSELHRIQGILKNPGVVLRLFVRSRRDVSLARRMRNKLPLDLIPRVKIYRLSRRRVRIYGWIRYSAFESRAFRWRLTLAAVLFGILIFVLTQISSLFPRLNLFYQLSGAKGVTEYRPKDIERQIKELEDRARKLKKMIEQPPRPPWTEDLFIE